MMNDHIQQAADVIHDGRPHLGRTYAKRVAQALADAGLLVTSEMRAVLDELDAALAAVGLEGHSVATLVKHHRANAGLAAVADAWPDGIPSAERAVLDAAEAEAAATDRALTGNALRELPFLQKARNDLYEKVQALRAATPKDDT